MEPVDPTIEIGLGPSHTFRPGSTTARPGHAGGGAWAEQRVNLTCGIPFSFLFKTNPPENPNANKFKTHLIILNQATT